MKSKLFTVKYLAAVCTLACASQAYALLPTDPVGATVAVSGASAQTPGLLSALTGVARGVRGTFGFCVAGTDTVYSLGNNDRAVFCTFKNAAPAPASLRNLNVLVLKRDGGGSGYGVFPFYGTGAIPTSPINFVSGGETSQPLKFIALNTCTQSVAPTAGASGTGTCTANTTLLNPNVGLSDVEPTAFDSQIAAHQGAATGSLTTGMVLQGFGVAVNTQLRNALQTAQSLTSGSELPADQPNLTRQQYAAIAGGAANFFQTDWSSLTANTTRKVTVCRRVPSSGTQQSSNAHFFASQCSIGPLGGALAVASAQGTRGTTFAVVENSGTGDVKTCLNTADASTNEWGVGVMSLENAPGASVGDAGNWRFVKLDGVSPTAYTGPSNGLAPVADPTQIRNMVEGNYGFAYEGVAIARNGETQAADFVAALKASFNDITIGPLTGLAVVPGTKFYTDDPTQVAKATRSGNSCQGMVAQ